MVNRTIIGYHRHGPIRQIGRHNGSDVPPMVRLKACLKKFEKTGNRELLIDAANYLQAEYVNPHHPKAHFRALDQDRDGQTL